MLSVIIGNFVTSLQMKATSLARRRAGAGGIPAWDAKTARRSASTFRRGVLAVVDAVIE